MRTIAVKHNPLNGLLRPFLSWAAGSLVMLLLGDTITSLLLWAFSFNEDITNTISIVAQGTFIGGYFIAVLGAYAFSMPSMLMMPKELVKRDNSSISLMKPVRVEGKRRIKRILALPQTGKVEMVSNKSIHPDSIWWGEDFIPKMAIEFDQIKAIWIVPEIKNFERKREQGKTLYGMMLVLTANDTIYAQTILDDLDALKAALDDLHFTTSDLNQESVTI